MTTLYERNHTAEFLLSEASGTRSREAVVINATAGNLVAGTVISLITSTNAATATADAGNTGNGVFGAITVTNDAITGTYLVEVTAEAAGAGTFSVTDPNGVVVGTGTVAVAFAGGGLSFTIADGSADFKVGDKWTVAVNAGLGEWVAYDDDGTNDGRRTASGILYAAADATTSDVRATAIVRDAEVAAARLTGLDAAARADLKALGIIVRD